MCLMPLGDDNSDRTTAPIVNYVLIGINIFVFVFLQGLGTNEKFTYAFSTVPAEIISGKDITTESKPFVDERGQAVVDPETRQPVVMPGLQPTPISVYITLITSMFMHGSFAHIFGNMLFLWIFGDNLEDDLGRPRYTIYYLLCGVLASLAHVALNTSGPGSLVPSLGASGAISGVLGGYIFLHPQKRVKVIILRVFTEVPAWVAIGLWFGYQILLGFMEGQGGGVAYGAHVGGFIAGLALVPMFMIGRRRDHTAAPPAWLQKPTGRGDLDL